MKAAHLVRILVLALTLTSIVGCGSSSSSSPTAPSGSAAPAASTLNLAGTWTGSIAVQGDPQPTPIRSWTITQTGASVSGPAVVGVEDENGAQATVTATMSGTVSGSQLQATFTVPVGAIPDPSLAACGFSGTGTLTASASSISGPMTVTFPAACIGPDSVSRTPTATWTFTFSK
jgi:hypothetical protein